jgi:FtsP/CotA-like multicopper oxidase with cupredoxin domain
LAWPARSPEVDGSDEEVTPFIPPHGRRKFTFTPEPAGTRWYHTHAMAGSDLNRGGYTGQFGFLHVEPNSEPGSYDQEIFLAAHHWGPSLAHMGPADNVWEIACRACSLNNKALGHGEPIRVRQGQRVLLRFLNASATDDIELAFPGHRFKVVGFDGNPVPSPRTVEVLQLAIAERVDAVVEMNQPGISEARTRLDSSVHGCQYSYRFPFSLVGGCAESRTSLWRTHTS